MKKYTSSFQRDWQSIKPIAEHVGALLYALNMADDDDRDKTIKHQLAGEPFETVLEAWRQIVLIQFNIEAGNNIEWGADSAGENFMEDLKRDVWVTMQGNI